MQQPNAEKGARRWPYLRWYNAWEWRWHRTVDMRGPAFQINLGRLGLTIPTRDLPPAGSDTCASCGHLVTIHAPGCSACPCPHVFPPDEGR